MKLDGKVKGGLAWAGLVVILAVPAADILFGNADGNAPNAAMTADAQTGKPLLKVPTVNTPTKADTIETASVTGGDAVDKLLAKGKKLPSYISDGDTAATPKPVTLKPITPAAQPAKAPVEVATVAPAETPPVPLPRSARPKTTQVASLPAEEKPLILDENKVKQHEQKAAVEPFPLSDNPDVVTGDQLEEWDSGSLADYLARKGLLSETSAQPSDNYDPDGFYLDEGPNRPRRPRNDFFLF
ncbi:MAG: hypothetical protein JWQ89_832 [Devosia sp.]|uniref:hypothetical protein n=1 Tax=Devosia sp. TaxID=1871048 RepID=UPI0026389EFB|nr:hypothetical protein [Devosia sp.]MDB5539105.1 hypothetical protein [Devosia sp.]